MSVRTERQHSITRPLSLGGWKLLLAQVAYPGILMVTLAAAWWGPIIDFKPAVVVALILIFSVVMAGILEYLLPFRSSWRVNSRTFMIDFIHSAVSSNGVFFLVQLSVYPVLADVGTRFIELAGTGLWPSNWPLVLQLALALLIADFGAYWVHRFMHTNRIGWRMHALHHSTERLHFLASGRAHPFNAFLTLSCEAGLLVMLGIPSGTLILFMVFKGVNGLLQHSNIDLRPGLLNYVFATNDVHRWHHSDNQVESSKNFGNTTMIWDHIFGSFYCPHKLGPAHLGISDAHVPEDYWVHLGLPFTLSHYEKS